MLSRVHFYLCKRVLGSKPRVGAFFSSFFLIFCFTFKVFSSQFLCVLDDPKAAAHVAMDFLCKALMQYNTLIAGCLYSVNKNFILASL